MSKDELRKLLREQRNNLSESTRQELASKIQHRLFESKEYLMTQELLIYVAFRNEVETEGIIQRALADGKKVFVPRVEEEWMEFYQIDTTQGLLRSRLGILEPLREKMLPYQAAVGSKVKPLMLLPGLAFDHEGNRIGYGVGYYDQYLHRFEETYFCKLALAYEFQIVEDIPAKEHDCKVDMILCETGLIQCKKHQKKS